MDAGVTAGAEAARHLSPPHSSSSGGSASDATELSCTAKRGSGLAVAAALSPGESSELEAQLASELARLGELLQGITLVGECSPKTRDELVTLGERLSAGFFAAALRHRELAAQVVDARQFVVTDDRFGAAQVDMEATRGRLPRFLKPEEQVPVVTGFTGATPSGVTTTLGRGGSDLTAAIVGLGIAVLTSVSGGTQTLANKISSDMAAKTTGL